MIKNNVGYMMNMNSKKKYKILKYKILIFSIFLIMGANTPHAAEEETYDSDYSLAGSIDTLTETEDTCEHLKCWMNFLSRNAFNQLTSEEKKEFRKIIEEYSPQISLMIYDTFQNRVESFESFKISHQLVKDKIILENYSKEKIEQFLQQVVQGENPINKHPELVLKNDPNYPLVNQIRNILSAAITGEITFKDGKIRLWGIN